MPTSRSFRPWMMALLLAGGLAAAMPATAATLTPQSVQIDGQALFTLASSTGHSAEERASQVNRRLARWLEMPGTGEVLRIARLRKGPTLMLGEEPLLMITAEDAALNASTPDELARTWKQQIETTGLNPPPDQSKGNAEGMWALLRHALSLLGVLLGGAIAAWMVKWASTHVADEPRRYGLKLSERGIALAGGGAGFLVAAGTIGVTLSYLPINSMPIAAAVVVVGAFLLVMGAEMLGNFAGGMVILAQGLFALGDSIRFGGYAGRVEKIGWLFTHLKTMRFGLRLIPNGAVLRRGVALLDRPEATRLALPVRLAYTVPRELAEAIVVEAACRTEGIADDPLPTCLVSSLEDDSLRYELQAYVQEGVREEIATSHFQINLLEVLAENELGAGGSPSRPRLRIGLTALGEGKLTD